MSKDNIIQFPTQKPALTKEQEADIFRHRIDEIEIENQYMKDDIAYLENAVRKNTDELSEILKQLAIMNGIAAGEYEPVIEFENEWGDDFEFTPDFEIKDNPEED
tara:strand:- start:107 stop:421 length:315 start_codon:yes stop_codon:yes gene_type:complete